MSLAINYRPISVLSPISQIYERSIHQQLYQYFESKEISFSSQFGFSQNKSTVQSCTSLLRYWYDTLDRGDIGRSSYLDFQKVFHSVDQ